MIARIFVTLGFMSLGLLSLFFLALSKDPLCIDSMIVERIDIHFEDRVESAYRCTLRREVAFSEYFYNHQKFLAHRLQRIDRLLKSIRPLQQRVILDITTKNPLKFDIKGDNIILGSDLLEREDLLEKALFKVWFREQTNLVFAGSSLNEEVITDFMGYLISGKLPEEGDRLADSERWLRVMRPTSSYCESSWVAPEDLEICTHKLSSVEVPSEQFHVMNLRPLLSRSWVKAYLKLSAKERYIFVKKLPLLLENFNQKNPVDSDIRFAQLNNLQAANDMIVSFKRSLKLNLTGQLKFYDLFAGEIKASGFEDDTNSAFFDLLFVSLQPLDEKSPLLKSLRQLSKANPRIQIAVKDDDHLWILPTKSSLNLNQFGEVRAHRTVVEKCGSYDFNFVMEYSSLTDKLLVVDHCQGQREIAYGGFLTEGIERFAQQNRSVSFVQFHLPSLLMKKSDLLTAGNVTELIKDQNNSVGSYQKLGWHGVRWDNKANFYTPESYNDAIQSFRIIN